MLFSIWKFNKFAAKCKKSTLHYFVRLARNEIPFPFRAERQATANPSPPATHDRMNLNATYLINGGSHFSPEILIKSMHVE